MENNSRRDFITKIGTAMGVLTFGNSVAASGKISSILGGDGGGNGPSPKTGVTGEVDFRYAPSSWQSTYCFPDDPYKSLVGKMGELLYGHPGKDAEFDVFPHTVLVGLRTRGEPSFAEQSLESPSVPVITTRLTWPDAECVLVSFASNDGKDGRVDNLIIEFRPVGAGSLRFTPEIIVKSTAKFSTTADDHASLVAISAQGERLFMAVDAKLQQEDGDGVHHFIFPESESSKEKPLRYFVRFPQAGQSADSVKDRLDDAEKLLKSAREFWQSWKPTEGKVSWTVPEPLGSFMTASVRNMVQSREEKQGKKIFQVGPTVYRGQWIIDGCSLTEAARYLGCDAEAQQGLEAMWSAETADGLIIAGAGEKHWKDTAAAVYALVRHAELSQDWTFFNEMYPDAHKSLMRLQKLIKDAENDDTLSTQYGILPPGFGDSGIGGIRGEFTNTLWTLMALRAIVEIAERFGLYRRDEIATFYTRLRASFYKAAKAEMRKHSKGFSYLPMVLSNDPAWKETDPRKQPRPQAAQIYVSQAIYPGLIFVSDDAIVKGHIALMRETMKEDVPFESGWLKDNAVWPYNGAVTAQAFLWAGLPDLARRMFFGFLNHASPLYAWREEQSVHDAPVQKFIGDMPHNWASAECIRYLRHMLLMEDLSNLRLFTGLGKPEMTARKPFSLVRTPTRWGRVTLTMEPIENNRWRTTFKREDFDAKTIPPLSMVEMVDVLPGGFYMEKMHGATVLRSGRRILVPGDTLSWDCTWVIPK
jgi:hypothetical protein